MKGFRRLSGGLAVALCIFLAGCGTNMAKLTAEEEEIIVAYASGVIAKANKSQSQGLTYLYEEAEEETEEEIQQDSEEEPEETSPGEAADVNVDENSAPESTESEETANTATLTEVLNIASVTAEYQGYQVSDSYVEGDYFALNAETGNTYLILNIGLANMSQEPVECNILEKNLSCSILINGEQTVEAMPTILLNDFATYVESIESATVADTILLFEVPKEAVANIQTLTMDIEAEGTLYRIELE